MDAAALSPFLSTQGTHYYKNLKKVRDTLRNSLQCAYGLHEFDIVFFQSVRIGLAVLSHVLHENNASLKRIGDGHYLPIAETFGAEQPSDYQIVTHVSPYTGEMVDLCSGLGKTVVDASHSFATLHHQKLISDSQIFIAPLHKHASITIGVALLAVKKGCLDKTVTEKLSLFEQCTASSKPYEEAMAMMERSNWQPYNVACINPIEARLGNRNMPSISAPQLPFVCFQHPSIGPEYAEIVKKHGGAYFPEYGTFRLSYMSRGNAAARVDHTLDVVDTLQQITLHIA